MYFDENIQNVCKIYKITNDCINLHCKDKSEIYVLASSKFILISQEIKYFLKQVTKYNIFYCPSNGYTMYIPFAFCKEHITFDNNQTNKLHDIIKEDSLKEDKMHIIYNVNNIHIQTIGDKLYKNILDKEQKEYEKHKSTLSHYERESLNALEEFEKYKQDFMFKFNSLLNEYNLDIYYNMQKENTYLKYKNTNIDLTLLDLKRKK